jgi:hypothetical protein
LLSLKPGTRVICPTQKESRRLEAQAADLGIKDVTFIAANPHQDLRDAGVVIGRLCPTVVTHDWLQQHWEHRIERIASDVEDSLDDVSGVHLGRDRPTDFYHTQLGESYVG